MTTPEVAITSPIVFTLSSGKAVLSLGVSLSEPISATLSGISDISQLLNAGDWEPIGSIDAALPVSASANQAVTISAVVRASDDDLFDGVWPRFSLDFDISSLKDEIISFLEKLEQSGFDLKSVCVFCVFFVCSFPMPCFMCAMPCFMCARAPARVRARATLCLYFDSFIDEARMEPFSCMQTFLRMKS